MAVQNPPSPIDSREHAISLFTYLRELARLRSVVVRDVEQYEAVLWVADLPRERECYARAWGGDAVDGEDLWLQVKKPQLANPPTPPNEIRPWIRESALTDSSEIPELLQQTVVGTGPEFQNLEDHPEVTEIWEEYLESQWFPWAEETERLRTVQSVYAQLHSIYQQQKKLGEAYELIFGLGLLSWQTPSGQTVFRHLIAARAAIDLDGKRGTLSVGPAGDGAQTVLEQEMLEPSERPNAEVQRQIEETIAQIGDDIWSPVPLRETLSSWVNAVSPEGSYVEDLSPPKKRSAVPIAVFAPALILRKRTERSLVATFEEIIRQIQNGATIPEGVLRVVDIRDAESTPEDSHEEVYFPLPSNREQRKIIEALARRTGVLVQGPPGTGKSHTIANLISHLLASGKRVLVTSETPRALKVIKGMIPADMAALCVSLLGNDAVALKELETSVQRITEKQNDWEPASNTSQTSALATQLDKLRRSQADLQRKLRESRERETCQHRICDGEYAGTGQRIAERIAAEKGTLGWLEGSVERDAPPLSNDEALELLRLCRGISKDQAVEATKTFPHPQGLMPCNEFAQLCEAEREAQNSFDTLSAGRASENYSRLAECPRERVALVKEALQDLRDERAKVFADSQGWISRALSDTLSGQDGEWDELLSATHRHLRGLMEGARLAQERKISLPTRHDRTAVVADAKALLKYLDDGGSVSLPLVRPKVFRETRYIFKEARVNGRRCDSRDAVWELVHTFEVDEMLNTLWSYWSAYSERIAASRPAQVARLESLAKSLAEVLSLRTGRDKAKQTCDEIAGLSQPLLHRPEEIEECLRTISAVEALWGLNDARAPLESLEHEVHSSLATDNHPIVEDAYNAIKARNVEAYEQCMEKLTELAELRTKVLRKEQLESAFAEGAPESAAMLNVSPELADWDDRLSHFEEAWRWAQANTWLQDYVQHDDDSAITARLDTAEVQVRTTTGELAAKLAWGHCLTRMSESERQHLRAWTHEMRKIGKGTGKRAELHRRAARENMEQCRSAIPAWVMPLYRVAETIKPGVDAFDVVIIDEASQSRPDALFLQFIANKIVVVGDDEQISPDNIGIRREEVDALQERYLREIPLAHTGALGIESSFFDLANILFGGRIVLREHFRCMPEIIQFSNNLCYTHAPLIPLRQYPPERLNPVEVRHVPTGYREGDSQRAINRAEAEALSKQIAECCHNPAYNSDERPTGKLTMGVISLLGESQARLIEGMLRDSIGPEEMEQRQLICGDAYAFQGDERDVIFLSLVAAPGDTAMTALTSAVYRRRFNVAASRARDQMWLFHSPTLNDFRNHECLRYKLLSYCQNPGIPQIKLDGLDLQTLRSMARDRGRTKGSQPPPFGSWFEVDVFLELSARGYRAIPQFRIANYRVDLVVEGMTRRLAVECDGDECHSSPQQLEKDEIRERILRRAGLIFWRVRGSVFYRDPDLALAPLWRELERLRIASGGKDILDGREAFVQGQRETVSISEWPKRPGTNVAATPSGDTESSEGTLFEWTSPQRAGARDLSSSQLEDAIIAVLKVCPNRSCTKESLTRRVLGHVQIITRGAPRERFHRRLMRALGKLKERQLVEEYVATNVRIRLLSGAP
jgi:very-short-patch-repair endonuclease